jgi:predicted CoA-binding protein
MTNDKNRAIYNSEQVELVDGTVVTLKSLPIKPLREFMDIWDAIDYDKAEKQSEILDQMFNAAAVAVIWCNKEVTKEDLEESLDQDTMKHVIEICAGIKMMSPEDVENLMREQAKAKA